MKVHKCFLSVGVLFFDNILLHIVYLGLGQLNNFGDSIFVQNKITKIILLLFWMFRLSMTVYKQFRDNSANVIAEHTIVKLLTYIFYFL